MSKFINIAGQKFGKLTVIKLSDKRNDKNQVLWECKCDCGKESVVLAITNYLTSGNTKSCGCLKRENTRKALITHGRSNTRTYNIWVGILVRCENKNCQSYFRYGGRGIKVCKQWHKFENFYKDMGDPPDSSFSIDRINVNGNYCPENCRWATRKQQSRNKKNSNLITFNGKTQCLIDWAKEIGITNGALSNRLKYMPLEIALTRPSRRKIVEPVFCYMI